MATIKPRITVTLELKDYELLAAFAKFTKQSQSAILAELWTTTSPVIARSLFLAQEASKVQQSAKDGLLKAAQAAHDRLVPLSQRSVVEVDLMNEEITRLMNEAAPPHVRGTRAAGGRRRSTAKPPSSNTGVRFAKGRGVGPQAKAKKS